MSDGRTTSHGRAARLRLDERWQAVVRRFGESGAGRLWGRLSAVDFFGHSFQLAALALLCFFPFLIVVTAMAGRDAAAVVAGWLGLDQQAAQAVASLFAPGTGAYTLTVVSVFLLVLGAVAVAGTLQSWYRMLFDVPGRGWRDIAAQLAWLVALLAYAAATAAFGRAFGGWLLQILIGLVWAVLFWWGSMYVLFAGAVPWRALFPPALATSVCWMGLGVFSARYFSAAIVANEQKYGPVGVVMVILSWLVAVGVVIHLGATVGRVYAERRARPPARRQGRRGEGGPEPSDRP